MGKYTNNHTESVYVDEEVEVRRKLERDSGPLPDAVWEDLVTDGYVGEYLDGTLEPDPKASWQTLKSEAGKRTRLVRRC